MRTKQQVIIQNRDGAVSMAEIEAETVGKNRTVIIHREIETDGNGNPVANGDTWVVTFRQSGHAMVRGIKTRAEARRVAQRFVPVLDVFRAMSLEETAATFPYNGAQILHRADETKDAVRALASAEGFLVRLVEDGALTPKSF